MLETAIAQLHFLEIKDNLTNSFRERRISVKTLANLSSRLKKGDINGTTST